MAMLPGAAAVYQLRDGALLMPYHSAGLPSMLGFTPERYDERVAGDNLNLIMTGDLDYVRTSILDALRSGEDVDCSYRTAIDGGYHWMHIRGRFIGENEGFPMLLVEFSDTTEEARMQENLLDSSSEAIFVIDSSTFETSISTSLVRDFGMWKATSTDLPAISCSTVLRNLPLVPIPGMEGDSRHWRSGPSGSGKYIPVDYRRLSWYGRPAFLQHAQGCLERMQNAEEA